MKFASIAQEKFALTRRELQEIVVLTSKLTTQVGIILTSKTVNLFNSFSIVRLAQCKTLIVLHALS